MPYKSVMMPITIRNFTFPNRLVMAPMHVNLADAHGRVTDALIEFYKPVAENGMGTIIVGATSPAPGGGFGPKGLNAFDDEHVHGFSRLFRMIADRGAVPGVQISHVGRQNIVPGVTMVAPSAIPAPFFEGKVRELTHDEVLEMEDRFAISASMLWSAGARLIEIHCAHGFLLNQFISPASNRRKDEYGGDLGNRLRIVLNILRKIRERVDQRLIISCRISSEELVEDGTTLEQSCEIASTLLWNGADIIHVSGGVGYASGLMLKAISDGIWLKNAGIIKKHVRGPVIAVGCVNSLTRAEEILDAGAADFVAMARALLADPELVSKSLAGREDEVNTCIDCNACYAIISPEFPPVCCTQKPVLS
ncbi:hypothetical protein HZA56_17585 [Candidatus Poribacteria bacterium]|nr:hypothetical protein [Candidatus Poribacteria bacterium]